MNSFLRWAGSKKQIVARLGTFCPTRFQRYIEPFAGSACLFFHLQPPNAILGDLNHELVSTIRAVQRDVELVLECLRRLRKGRRFYYAIRRIDPSLLPEPELAARFIYLNHYCFNGLYRTNSSGQFNVPYGPPKNGCPINEERIRRAARTLQEALLIHGDFEETLAYAEPGDFVYLDPPYAVKSRRIFSEYLPTTFSRKDLDRFGSALQLLDKKRVRFLITYTDSPEARHLLARWKPCRIWTHRNIAGFAGDRRGAFELVATNAAKGLPHDN